MQTRYTDVDNAINAIELEKNTAGLVHVLLPATPPLNPKASKKLFILAGAFPLAFLLGAGAAVFAQKLDPKIYVGDDVARVLTFEPMAILPDPSDVTPSTVEEFMLRLVAGVDQAHRTGGARTFVFTSATPGASITPIVAAVAHMMERYGYSAMLLDASTVLENVALPKEEPSYLLGDIEIARPSQVRLANTKRDTYTIGNFSKIKKNVDLLFIEGLPLLASAESEFAARLADVTILVAESANTTRTQLASSLALVKRLGVPGVAAVLSGVSLRYADTQFLTVVQDVEQRQASTPVRPPAPQPVESAPEPAAAEPAIPRQDYDLYTRDKKVASTR
jgi:succinoglycan biosynthesis transport protein ExoP